MAQFVVGVMDGKSQTFEWIAENRPVQAQFLVSIDLDRGGVDPEIASRYESALKELSRQSTGRQDLSEQNWLFATELGLKEVFQVLVNELGIEHHAYAAVELATGEGLAFNAKRRVVYELSPSAS